MYQGGIEPRRLSDVGPETNAYTISPRRRLNLVMYVSAADNDYVGVAGTFLGTPLQGVWSTARLDFSVPPGGIAKLHFRASNSEARSPGWYSSGGHAGPVQHADQGQRLRGRVCLSNGPARTCWPLRAWHAGAGQLGCNQLLRELHGRVHNGRGRLGAVSPAQRSQPQAPSPERMCIYGLG